MHHLAQTRLAECAHQLLVLYGALEGSNLTLMKMKEPQDERPLCVDDELALASEDNRYALHARLNERRLARRRRVHRRQDRLVLVAQRQVQDQVEAATQPQLLHLAGLHSACRMASISTSAPRGRPATPTAARDG